MQTKLRELKEELKRRWHEPIPIQGQWLKQVVTGWFNYKFGKLPAVFDGERGLLGHFDASYPIGLLVMALIAFTLIRVPLKNAGDPNEPAPPAAIM